MPTLPGRGPGQSAEMNSAVPEAWEHCYGNPSMSDTGISAASTVMSVPT